MQIYFKGWSVQQLQITVSEWSTYKESVDYRLTTVTVGRYDKEKG